MLGRIGRSVLEVGVAVLAFVAGAEFVRARLPWAEGGKLDQKLAHLAAADEGYDVVFVGSSRVLDGFDPRVFEAELAGAGFPLKAFNLGALGAETFEQDWVLRRVLERASPRLRWILLESGPVGLAAPRHAYRDVLRPPSARDVQWHDPRTTRTYLGALAAVPLGPARKLELALQHLDLAARNVANFGRGLELVASLRGGSARRAWIARADQVMERTGGFQALDPEASGWGDGERAMVAELAADNARTPALDELDADVYRAQVAAAAARGVEVVYVTLPALENNAELLALHDAGVVPALLHGNDPVRHPELFDPAERFDRQHVNRRGAERFSRLLARAFLQHVRPERDGKETE